ncbi:hypothetical protein MBLNU457_g2937t1 [Dothideomycetes sp. NU457]
MNTLYIGQRRRRPDIECHYCHRHGHYENNCWTKHPERRPERFKNNQRRRPGTQRAKTGAPCHFLRLPAELRTIIYEYALYEWALRPGTKVCVYNHSEKTYYGNESYIQPKFTRVNQQIRAEALPMFYGMYTFVLYCEGPSHFISWQLGLNGRPPKPHCWEWITSNHVHLQELRHIQINNLDCAWVANHHFTGLPSGSWDLDIQMVRKHVNIALPDDEDDNVERRRAVWRQTSLTKGSSSDPGKCLYRLLHEAVGAVQSGSSLDKPGRWFELPYGVICALYKMLDPNLKMTISVNAKGRREPIWSMARQSGSGFEREE